MANNRQATRIKRKGGFTLTPKHRCDLPVQGGFTLIELMIASGLFIILISIATGAFINTLRTQRIITELSEDMNNVSFVMEQMSREIRVGYDFDTTGEDSSLSFMNSSYLAVRYSRVKHSEDSTYGIERCEEFDCEFITAPEVNIERLRFILTGEDRGDGLPPRVTALITVKGEKNIRVNLQTTISSRLLEL